MQASVLTSDWIQEKLTHEQRVDDLIGPYLIARSHHKKQPVLDFLFEYYHFRPAMLRNWSPGLGVELSLSDQDRQHLPQFSELQVEGTIAFLDPSLFPDTRRKSLDYSSKRNKKGLNLAALVSMNGPWCTVQTTLGIPKFHCALAHKKLPKSWNHTI